MLSPVVIIIIALSASGAAVTMAFAFAHIYGLTDDKDNHFRQL